MDECVYSNICHYSLNDWTGSKERDSEYMNLVEDYLHGLHTLQDHYELPLRLAYTQIRERERERERREREREGERRKKERERERK